MEGDEKTNISFRFQITEQLLIHHVLRRKPMLTRKFLNTLISLVMITSLVLGGVTQASAQEPKAAPAKTIVRGSRQPHGRDKGPALLRTLSELRQQPADSSRRALVTITASNAVPATVTRGNPLIDREQCHRLCNSTRRTWPCVCCHSQRYAACRYPQELPDLEPGNAGQQPHAVGRQPVPCLCAAPYRRGHPVPGCL